MSLKVDRLPASQAEEASSLLTRAFSEDPVITHFLWEPTGRAIAFPAFFRAALAESLPLGHVYAIDLDGSLAGVAAWFPPDSPQPDPVTTAEVERYQHVVREAFPDTAEDLFNGFAAMGDLHPSEPHWYLAFIGIDPDLQSRGFGTQVLSPVLQLADDTKTLCYLETPFPRTHAFYKRLGFEPGREARPFTGAPSIWTFIRSPS